MKIVDWVYRIGMFVFFVIIMIAVWVLGFKVINDPNTNTGVTVFIYFANCFVSLYGLIVFLLIARRR